MYQIVCRLGLCPRELTALPRPPSWFRGGPPGKGRREGGKKGREGKGREGVPECPNPQLASLPNQNPNHNPKTDPNPKSRNNVSSPK